ncbi:C39 family peptidase [Streptomyces sp. NPDC050095]|uniref:C39 family peptidase n=1 Tax=unclassified Streptomyces TaxID=2593676 RepID=UPI0034297BD8
MPVITQYASADLVEAIAYAGHDPADDPAWRQTGAPTQAAYGRWCRHMCGIACLQMVLLHRDGEAPNLFQLLAGARHYRAYEKQPDGTVKGLIYAPFVQYVEDSHRMAATAHVQLGLDQLDALLDDGRMVMASVSKEIRRPEQTPERRGGHLVLVIGRTADGAIVFRNPSGHRPETRSASLPRARFAEFFAERGVSLDLHPQGAGGPRPHPRGAVRPVAS